MTWVNDPTAPKTHLAPRFFLGITTFGFIYRFRHDVPTNICTQVQTLIDSKQPVSNLQGPPTYTQEIENILNTHEPIKRIWCGPAYYFPEDLPQSAQVVPAQRKNIHIFSTTFPYIEHELDDIQPCMVYVINEQAVSVCQTVRRSPHAEEAGLDTHEDYRGQGYGPWVASAWAKAVKSNGKIPLYSTSWENQSSQRVAEKLGLIQFGIDYHVT